MFVIWVCIGRLVQLGRRKEAGLGDRLPVAATLAGAVIALGFSLPVFFTYAVKFAETSVADFEIVQVRRQTHDRQLWHEEETNGTS